MRKRWLIRGLALLAVLAAAYTAYWFWLARTFEQQLALWIDQQRAMGYRIEYAASEPTGYPLWIEIQLSGVTATPTFAKSPWRLDAARTPLSLAPWRPLVLHVGERESPSQHRLRWMAAGQAYEATIKGLRLAIEFSANEMPPSFDIYNWSINLKQGGRDIVSFGGLAGRIELANAATHADSSVSFDLASRAVNFLVPSLPQETIETYQWQITGKIMGQIPPEPLPHALASWSNEGGYLDLTQLKANWEAITDVSIDGSIALDQQLQPIASMTARLRNYGEMIDWLESIGVLPQGQGLPTKLALGAMTKPASDGGDEPESRVPVTIQDGFVTMGPVKLAQLPPIVWQ